MTQKELDITVDAAFDGASPEDVALLIGRKLTKGDMKEIRAETAYWIRDEQKSRSVAYEMAYGNPATI